MQCENNKEIQMTGNNQNIYKIDFRSELGQRVAEYFTRCAEAEAAARDFIRGAGKWGFLPCDDATEYLSPDDADAGGVMAICIPSRTAREHWGEIDHVMWDHVEDRQTEEGQESYISFFPRVTIEMHYMRHDKALRLEQRMSPEWDFMRDETGAIKHYLFDDIRRQCPSQDVREMTPKTRVAPAPQMHCALGTKYVMDSKPDDALRIPLPTSKPFADAVALCKAVKALPVVPANSLALVLGLRSREKKVRREDVYCEYRIDKRRRCYLVRTGLVSDNPDFKHTSVSWEDAEQ